MRAIEELTGDWRGLDERIEGLSKEIEALAGQDPACERLMTVPGIGPIISSAMVTAIGNGAVFAKGRDWVVLVRRFRLSNSILGCGQQCHKIIQNRLALVGEESVSVGHRRHRPG